MPLPAKLPYAYWSDYSVEERTADPATPGSNDWQLYFKAGGLYCIDDAGSVSGPFVAGAGYLRKDGTVALTANWDAGGFNIRAATVTPDGLTSGRVVFAGANGLLSDDASLIFNTTNNNLGLVATSFGTNAVGVFALGAGTAPTTSPADVVQMWAADRGGTAGKCGLHIRTEDGTSHVFGDLSGIGTTTPGTKLDVNGLIRAGSTIVTWPTTGAGIEIAYNQTIGVGYVQVYNRGTSTWGILSFGNSNVGIATTSFGTNAVSVFAIGAGTAPTTSLANVTQLWSADVNAAAGYAWLHGRDEKGHTLIVAGVVLKTDTGHPANPHEGLIEINTNDNKVNIYGDAGWREMATW